MPRPPKATSILDVTGAFNKNPNRKRVGEPIPEEGMPARPKILRGRAARIWDRVAPQLYNMGTMRAVDADEFATWCVMQARFEEDPERFVETAAWVTAKRTAAEKFGIVGASSRAKIGIEKSKDKVDPAEKYFDSLDGSGNAVRQ